MLGPTFVASSLQRHIAQRLPRKLAQLRVSLSAEDPLTTAELPDFVAVTSESRFGLLGNLNSTPIVMVDVLQAGPLRRHDWERGMMGEPTDGQVYSRAWSVQVIAAVNLTGPMEGAWRHRGVDSWAATRYVRDAYALAVEEILLGDPEIVLKTLAIIEGTVQYGLAGATDPDLSERYREAVVSCQLSALEQLHFDALGYVDERDQGGWVTVHLGEIPA